MKRLILALTLLGTTLTAVNPALANDWSYGHGYPPAQRHNDVLKQVLIGGALVGIGYLAGRMTAPQNNYGYAPNYGYQPQPQFQPSYGYRGYYAPQMPTCGHRF
jgi:hypothetical protein